MDDAASSKADMKGSVVDIDWLVARSIILLLLLLVLKGLAK
jgi:hypothetical protein